MFLSTKVYVFLMLQPLRVNLFTSYYQDYNILNLFFDVPSPQSSLVFFIDLVKGFWHIYPNIKFINIHWRIIL